MGNKQAIFAAVVVSVVESKRSHMRFLDNADMIERSMDYASPQGYVSYSQKQTGMEAGPQSTL